jgi:Asp-tRNA(Asn)/Glu-tRNA(Gln) amidotransferase A subunit family amidase
MFAHVPFDAARDSEKASDDRVRRGEWIGVLDGIPTSIRMLSR